MQKLGTDLNELGKTKLDIERGSQKAASLKTNVEKLDVELAEQKTKIEALKQEIEPLGRNLENLHEQKRRLQTKYDSNVCYRFFSREKTFIIFSQNLFLIYKLSLSKYGNSHFSIFRLS